MMQYGDEIGIGDNLKLPERECARTPMQWTGDTNAGFSTAKRLVRPVIDDEVFGYEKVNVAALRNDPESLLNRTERMIRMRKECPEISWGQFEVLRTDTPEVLIIRYDWRGTSLVTVHNFSGQTQTVRYNPACERGELMVDLFGRKPSHARPDGTHRLRLEPYGWRWMRVGGVDDTLMRQAVPPRNE
jgi:maltose alpha-D-glucosyltransferase / alpha-amylase